MPSTWNIYKELPFIRVIKPLGKQKCPTEPNRNYILSLRQPRTNLNETNGTFRYKLKITNLAAIASLGDDFHPDRKVPSHPQEGVPGDLDAGAWPRAGREVHRHAEGDLLQDLSP